MDELLGAQVVGEALGERRGGELGDDVGTAVGDADEPGHRRGVHDVRVAALLEHPGHEGPDAVEQAEEVHAEHPLPVGGGALPGDPGLEHAGVVAEQVDGAEAVVRRVGEGAAPRPRG